MRFVTKLSVAWLSVTAVPARHLDVLGKFPWQKVWDFGQESHESGVFNACKDDMEGKVKVFTWKDPLDQRHSLSDGTTDWVFVRGMVEKKDSMIVSENFRDWFSKVKGSLNRHCQQLSEQCEEKKKPLLVVILWYDNFEYLLHLTRLLEKIDESVDGAKFVLIMPHLPEDADQEASLKCLCKQFDIQTIPQIPLKKLCHNLYHCPCPFQLETCQKFKLPTADGSFLPDINEKDAWWYGEEIDVLYTTDTQELSPGNHPGESFLVGEPIEWSECDFGLLDAKRSLYNPIRQQLMSCIMKRTSAVITLFHEPCAGGTTLAKRLLWDLHFVTPCVSIQSQKFDTEGVLKRLESLYQKTNLPVVVLADRVEPDRLAKMKAENVLRNIPIVILALQCSTSDFKAKRHGGNQYFLSGSVDASEAASLAYVFSRNCTEEKKRELKVLSDDVGKGQPHMLVEFGLVVFGERYKVVHSFVRCYLGAVNAQLLPWQRALGYLAITCSYAQTGLPSEFFGGIFTESEPVHPDDLTDSRKQLISEDLKDSTWKIKHQVIADEILEQLLWLQPQHTNHLDQDCERLSKGAKDHLASFVVDFITYAGLQIPKMSQNQRSKVMDDVIYKMFFSPGEQMKYQSGRLFLDMDEVTVHDISGASMGWSSKQVLAHLSQCFPNDPIIGAFL